MLASRGHVMCLHPCALSGPYRPRGAHGFWPSIVHFSGKSDLFEQKLSDRMSESFNHSRGVLSCGAGGHLGWSQAPGQLA
jgi:hypothetical protein